MTHPERRGLGDRRSAGRSLNVNRAAASEVGTHTFSRAR
jgi:hypothetical protein